MREKNWNANFKADQPAIILTYVFNVNPWSVYTYAHMYVDKTYICFVRIFGNGGYSGVGF